MTRSGDDPLPWPEAEITRLAAYSGRPLEVQCGEVFLNKGWAVRLATYFVDGSTDKVRELDLLAEKHCIVGGSDRWVRAFVSVKGFKPEQTPVVYSVARTSQMLAPPDLLSSYRADLLGMGSLGNIAKRATDFLLVAARLKAMGEAGVGLDILERKRAKERNQPAGAWTYFRVTDRALYEGLDSAIKAAAFWADRSRSNQNHASLYVPMLVTASPFWSVRIDHNEKPVLRDATFMTGIYPVGDAMTSIVSLVGSVAQLESLVVALDSLLGWFAPEPITRERITE